jgi:hypothetical protein
MVPETPRTSPADPRKAGRDIKKSRKAAGITGQEGTFFLGDNKKNHIPEYIVRIVDLNFAP